MPIRVPRNNKQMMTKLESFRRITPEGCWIWTGSKYKSGYGRVWYKGTQWLVHRLSLFLFKPEEFRESYLVNHKCNITSCFNPDHLYSGDYSENANDSIKAGTHYGSSKTYCVHGHEYTEENTYINEKTGSRQCLICRKAESAFHSVLNRRD